MISPYKATKPRKNVSGRLNTSKYVTDHQKTSTSTNTAKTKNNILKVGDSCNISGKA